VIERINIAGYQRLKSLALELRPLNVLIGANASGKSNFLDSFALMREAVAGRFREAVTRRGGIERFLWAGGASEVAWEFSFSFSLARKRLTILYSGKVRSKPPGFLVDEERLNIPEKHLDIEVRKTAEEQSKPSGGDLWQTIVRAARARSRRGREMGGLGESGPSAEAAKVSELRPDELALPALPRAAPYGSLPTIVCAVIESIRAYAEVRADGGAPVRQPADVSPLTPLSSDGSNLSAVLRELQENPEYRDAYRGILQYLRAAWPDVQEITYPSPAGGKVSLALTENAFPQHPFWPHELSDGTLRFLCLASALLAPPWPELLLVDTPEASLHPFAVRLLADMLRQASQRTQVVVATQSPELVSAVGREDPKAIIVVEKHEGQTTMRRPADKDDLREWLKDFSMGELWLAGHLGGEP